jgi:hypothetical protein
MKVRALDNNLDWTFGKGKANYISSQKAIRQNVLTRIKSFTNDWFSDINNGIPWIELLGQKQTRKRILRAIESTVLQTEGVLSIQKLEALENKDKRVLNITIRYTDVFGSTEITTGVAI